MTYEETIAELKSNHITPDVKIKNGKIVALHINCSPITIDDKMERVRQIIPEGYLVRKINSDGDVFEIVKKKNEKDKTGD